MLNGTGFFAAVEVVVDDFAGAGTGVVVYVVATGSTVADVEAPTVVEVAFVGFVLAETK